KGGGRDQHGADEIGSDRAHEHDLPAGLAVTDQAGLALRVRVQLGDLGDEARLGTANVLHRLARHRILEEADEIAGMPGLQHFADLALVLHSADPRTLTGARVEDNKRTFARIALDVAGCLAANDGVVYRTFRRPPIEQGLEPEAQHLRRNTLSPLHISVSAPTP